MKPIAFSQKEQILLNKVLTTRLSLYNSEISNLEIEKSKSKFIRSYVDPIESVNRKYTDEIYNDYSKKERLAIRSCINDFFEVEKDLFDLNNPVAWLSISQSQKKLTKDLDTASDILSKCLLSFKPEKSVFYGERFRYKDVFDTINKLKGSEDFYISTPTNLYKIAFVYQDCEILTLELRNNIILYNQHFTSTKKSVKKSYSNYFSKIATRQEARQIIDNSNETDYPCGVIRFIRTVIS